ncbi:hypothetical protein YC2023_028898 [Brassica napus]
MVSRILYPSSRGQHAPSFTMTELSPGVVGLVGDAWRSSAFEHRQMGRDSLRWSTSAFLQAAIWYTGRVSCCQGPSFSPVLVTGFLAVNPTAGGPKLSLICALFLLYLVLVVAIVVYFREKHVPKPSDIRRGVCVGLALK